MRNHLCHLYDANGHKFETVAAAVNLDNVCFAIERKTGRDVETNGEIKPVTLKLLTLVFIGGQVLLVQSTKALRAALAMQGSTPNESDDSTGNSRNTPE